MIFIVDDEPLIGMMMEMTLPAPRYCARLFEDPVAALQAFGHADPKPDLLITDYSMPGMTGVDLMRECKVLHPALKTILVSGRVGKTFLKTIAQPPDQFLAKPFLPHDLLEVVKDILAG